MKQLAGVLFICKEKDDLEVWLGKRIRPPFQDHWSTAAGAVVPFQSGWDVASDRARKSFNVSLDQWIQERSAIKIGQFKYKIPFFYHFEIFVLAISEKRVIDDQLHLVGNFEETGWFSCDNLPPKTHLSVHYAMGIIDTERLSEQADLFEL